MLMSKTVIVNIGSATKSHYESLGYIIPKCTDRKDWKLEVAVEHLPKTSSQKVECSCEECGEIRTVRNRDLFRTRKSVRGVDGRTYCKDCVKRIRIGNPLYVQYKQNAKKRGLEFALSLDEFYEINHRNCHYCGGMNKYSRQNHTGNGIDRMDNDIGYTFSNCVPCCTICNRGKGNLPYRDFIKYIERIRNVKT